MPLSDKDRRVLRALRVSALEQKAEKHKRLSEDPSNTYEEAVYHEKNAIEHSGAAQRLAQSPLSKARGHLEKETERGDHSPKVGGHGTEQHGGRVPNNGVSHSFANEPEDNLKGSKGSGYRE